MNRSVNPGFDRARVRSLFIILHNMNLSVLHKITKNT